MTPSQSMLLFGSDEPPPPRVPLRAGPLTLDYEAGDLRYLRLGGREVIRRIYVAVRDHNWDTIPAGLSDERIVAGPDSFAISYTALHQRGPIQFRWSCRITGAADGTITLAMDGAAERAFRRNRIGICVLHPADCAGAPVRVEHDDGSTEHGAFPRAIAPHQPFLAIRALAHEVAPGCWAELRFAGELFEMEDQRNWSDGSFKIYGTPLSQPFPVELAPGERVAQVVTLRLQGLAPAGRVEAGPVALTVSPDERRALPALGLGVADDGGPLTTGELARLRALRPAHLRCELRIWTPDWRARLGQAAAEAAALGAPLELALVLDDAAAELPRLAQELAALRPAVARLLVFPRHGRASDVGQVRAAREALGPLVPGAPFGGGTLASFTELNRARPTAAALETVAYALNPQVHAFDLSSLAENLAAQADTVASARLLYPGLPVAVGPLTLRPQFNPAATGPEEAPAEGELPRQVDPRQLSLFGAAWTVGSLAAMAEGGAASVTLYETAGWGGVLERAAGSPLPARFPSTPGAVFPLYHVLAWAADLAGGEALAVRSSAPLRVVALALRRGRRWRILAANLTPEPQTALVAGLAGPARLRLLTGDSAELAGVAPEDFRAAAAMALAERDGALRLELPPCAVACVDGGETI